MVQYDAQMEELVLKRGAVPRIVLTAGLQRTIDMSIMMAINSLEMRDVISASPSARPSHKILRIHPHKWREGRKDPVRSQTVCLLSLQLFKLCGAV